MTITYLKYETLRMFRNRMNFIFSLIFPLVLFYVIVGSAGDAPAIGGVSFATYYMSGMISFGAMGAVIAGGARIAIERELGWNRQLRLTPLSPGNYIWSKLLTAYLLGLISLILVTLAGLSLGVHLGFAQWLETIGLVLVALIPFAAMGVMFGHLVKGDSMGPIIGGGMSLFSLVGGAYFPIGTGNGVAHDLVRLVPSFWLVQAGKTGIGGEAWTAEAWIVVAVWAVVLAIAAAWAYRRDTKRQ
jgi:ABC-2 type transport system permease protein